MIRLLMLDVGGVLFAEDELYAVLLASQKKALRLKGVEVSDEDFDRGVQTVIHSFVPSLQRAVAWHFTKPNIELCDRVTRSARAAFQSWQKDHYPELVPGIREALGELSKNYALALAANQDTQLVRDALKHYRMSNLFLSHEVSENIGLSKPDPRFFSYLLRKCNVQPREAIMVGDRLDNDIIPARAAGMRTILFRTGPYAVLEPRTPEEIPHETIKSAQELPGAVRAIAERQRH